MPRPAHSVELAPSDTATFRAIVKKGTHKSRKITRARALLLMGAGKGAAAVQTEAGICASQYYSLKRRYLTAGIVDALEERPRSGQPPKVTSALEAHLTSLACSDAPAGAARWTLALLTKRVVELPYVDSISEQMVRKGLKKGNASRG